MSRRFTVAMQIGPQNCVMSCLSPESTKQLFCKRSRNMSLAVVQPRSFDPDTAHQYWRTKARLHLSLRHVSNEPPRFDVEIFKHPRPREADDSHNDLANHLFPGWCGRECNRKNHCHANQCQYAELYPTGHRHRTVRRKPRPILPDPQLSRKAQPTHLPVGITMLLLDCDDLLARR